MTAAKVFLIGSEGRMGQELQALLSEWKDKLQDLQLTEKFDRNLEVSSVSDFLRKDIDLVIDFSSASLFSEVVSFCSEKKVPLVSGTTNLTDQHKNALKQLSQHVPVLWSPNMSLGVALFRSLIRSFSGMANQFQFQLEETHHIHKIDSPSGTAKWLQEELRGVAGVDVPEPLSIRGGGVFGIHKLWAMAEEETITIEHTALNRRVFARGALFAAAWLVKQPAGLYSVENVFSK